MTATADQPVPGRSDPATLRVPDGAPAPVAPGDPPLGTVLGDRYRLDAPLGRGSLSSTYRATDLALDRPVAVKLFAPYLGADSVFRRRFLEKAGAAAALAVWQWPGCGAPGGRALP